MARLSTCTLNWNLGDGIVKFLEEMRAAREKSHHEYEVIIVDNGSIDGSPDLIARDYPWVKLLRNPKNLGFAYGCNQAMEAATGDYLILLNPDCYANTEALDGMVDYLAANPSVGAVGCMLLHDDGLPQLSAHAAPSPTSFLFANSMLSPVLEKLKKMSFNRKTLGTGKPFECGWLMGSCIMVPRAVYEKVGALEPSFFIYSEDTDWCQRIRDAGWKVMHLPNLRMVHLHKTSTKRRPEFFFRRLYRSLLLYANRRMKPAERDRFCRAVMLDLYARRPVYWLQSLFQPSRRQALRERIASCTQLLAVYKARNPDLFDDPPPQS